MPKLTLYFLRHGQTQFNVYRRLQGWSNSQLTDDGVAVAISAGQEFADIHFEAVYSSDLTRAVETGKIFLAQRTDSTLHIEERKSLREVGFGYYEGLEGPKVWGLAEQRAREVYGYSDKEAITEAIKLDMLKELDPSKLAESYDDFTRRLLFGVEEIVSNHEEGNVLLVSHSSAIKAIFNLLDKDFNSEITPDNGSMSALTYENGRYRVLAYNSFNKEDFNE